MSRFFAVAWVLVTLSIGGCVDDPVGPASDLPGSEQHLLAFHDAGPPVQVSCGQVITQSVALANDLLDCPGNGIVVGADGIVIDGRGHLVDGPLNPLAVSYGILIEGHTGVTVKNVRITEFTIGVGIQNSSNSRVLLSRIAMNDLDGVGLLAANDNEVALNEFVGNAIAVNVTSSAGNRIALNRIVDPRFGTGITLSTVSRTHVLGNSIQGGSLNLNSATESRIEWNRITGALSFGYSIRGQSSDNALSYNSVTGVTGDGFSVFGISPVFGPTRNTLTGNWASGNTGDGFRMSGATSANSLSRNVSEGNGGFGFRDATSGGGTAGTANVYDRNRCRNNVAGASTPPELCQS